MNQSRRGENVPNPAAGDEAVAWFVVMRGPSAGKRSAEFERWLEASAEHRRAYQQVAQLFDDTAVLKRSRRQGVAKTVRVPVRAHRLAAGLAPAACHALAVIAGPTIMRSTKSEDHGADSAIVPVALETGRGEIRSFRLVDGSLVTLDTASRVEVMMGPKERRLRLRAGRARFAVARDVRPFIVEAGAGQATSSSGVLDVNWDERGQVGVSVVSGSAMVAFLEPSATFQNLGQKLPEGRLLIYRAADFVQTQSLPEYGSMLDRNWPSGWAEYRSVPLAILTQEANRYAVQPIVIDDPAVARLAVSGRFKLSDPAALALRLAEVFGLNAEQRADGIHLGPR